MFLSVAFVFPNIEDISYWSLTINEQEGKYTEYNRHMSGRVNTLNNNRTDTRGCSPLMSQSLKAALFYYYNKLQCKNAKGEGKMCKAKNAHSFKIDMDFVLNHLALCRKCLRKYYQLFLLPFQQLGKV